jgi:pimeloyl-ACP methyl ester carboxylesterase
MSIPPVVIIPGFPGSELSRMGTDDLVWIDLEEVVTRKDQFLQDVILTQNNYDALTPSGIVDKVDFPLLFKWRQYDRLVQFLRQEMGLPHHLVKPFAYDWRKSIKQAAERLHACVGSWRGHEFAGQQCVIIAHSTGGLVARYYIEKLGGDQDVQHLFLLGVPNTGLLKNFQSMYAGSNLYCVFTPDEVKQMSRSFETIYELLPRDPVQKLFVDQIGNGIQPFTDRHWIPATDAPVFTPRLDAAWAVVQQLPAQSSVPTTIVYSDGLDTFTRAVFDGNRVEFSKDLTGDLTVPSVSAATLSGAKIILRPVPFAAHADLYAYDAVQEILRSGLSNTPLSEKYLRCAALLRRIGRARERNKILVEMRDQAGQPLSQTKVAVESTPPFLSVQELPQSSRHPGQFELQFDNPQQTRTYAVFLQLHWTENGVSRRQDETLTLKVI